MSIFQMLLVRELRNHSAYSVTYDFLRNINTLTYLLTY